MTTHSREPDLRRLLATYGHTTHSHLFMLGDKEWFWDSEGEAVIAYRTSGSRRIALGDPVGDPGASSRVIRQFLAACRADGALPALYQTSSERLPFLHENGLQTVKIGEEARIDVPAFHVNGKYWLKMRNRFNKFQRSGYTFEVMMPPHPEPILRRLETISNEWLNGRKEKCFSVGSFSVEAVNRHPVAALLGPNGVCEAFASLPGGELDVRKGESAASVRSRQITVDLMRYAPSSPPGAMEVLFLWLFQWAQAKGFHRCSLGIAPLAGADFALGKLLYRYGNAMYNFKGLYDFKNKFLPEWEPVYLAYPPRTLTRTVFTLCRIVHSTEPSTMRTSETNAVAEGVPLQ